MTRNEGTLGQDKGSAALSTLNVVLKVDIVGNSGRWDGGTVASERSHDVPVPQREVADLQRFGKGLDGGGGSSRHVDVRMKAVGGVRIIALLSVVYIGILLGDYRFTSM